MFNRLTLNESASRHPVLEQIHAMVAYDAPKHEIYAVAASYFADEHNITRSCGDLLAALKSERHPYDFAALRELPEDVLEGFLGDYLPVFSAALLFCPNEPPPPSAGAPRPPTPPAHSRHAVSLSQMAAGRGSFALPPSCSSDAVTRACLTHPVLCRDGRFYERLVACGTELQEGGIVDCEDHPELSDEQWSHLARALPGFADRIEPAIFGWVCAAWARCCPPDDAAAEARFWLFHTEIAGAQLAAHVQCAAYASLMDLPSERLPSFAALCLSLAEPLAECGDFATEALAHVMAWTWGVPDDDEDDESDSDDEFQLPPKLLLAVARGAIEARDEMRAEARENASDDDDDDAISPVIPAAMRAFYTLSVESTPRPRRQHPSDSQAAYRLARDLSLLPEDALEPTVEAALLLTGATHADTSATLLDCANALAALSTMPLSARHALGEGLADAYRERGRGEDVWRLLGPVLNCDENVVAHCADLAAAYHMGHNPFVQLLQGAANIPPDACQAIVRILPTLLPGATSTPQQITDVFLAMRHLSAEQVAIFQNERGQLEADLAACEQPRHTRLACRQFLDRFVSDHEPVAGASNAAVRPLRQHRPNTHRETVMNSQRQTAMQQDLARIDRLLPAGQRAPCSEVLAQIQRYLESPAAAALARKQRVPGRNELQNAKAELQALAGRSASSNAHRFDIRQTLATVWQLIEQYEDPAGADETTREREQMRYSLACGLAEIIENDGHETCVWGQGQRLLAPLLGRYQELATNTTVCHPAELLTAMGSEFAQQLAALQQQEPTEQQLRHFCQRCISRAEQVLHSAADRGAFRARLIEYLQVSEWAVPDFLQQRGER